MTGSAVACADCRAELARDACDVVEYGTGYRCDRCSVGRQIRAHLAASEAAEAERRRRVMRSGTPWIDLVFRLFGR